MPERIKKSAQIIIGAAVLAGLGFLAWSNSGTATLTWNANTEPDLAGYRIYYGTAPRSGDCPAGEYAQKAEAGNATQHVLKNLKRGKNYYFSVASYDQAGNESCFYDEQHKKIN